MCFQQYSNINAPRDTKTTKIEQANGHLINHTTCYQHTKTKHEESENEIAT